MKKIEVRLQRTEEPSIFHDARKDARTISKAVNLLIDKVNELIDENTALKKRIEILESK